MDSLLDLLEEHRGDPILDFEGKPMVSSAFVVSLAESYSKSDSYPSLIEVYPYFLLSSHYSKWCTQEMGFTSSIEAENMLNEVFSSSSSSIEGRERCAFSSSGMSWLEIFINSVENLPFIISVSMATCEAGDGRASNSFPILYVNRSFESTSGFSSSEVLGEECFFLLSKPSISNSELQRATSTLRSALPLRAELLCRRSDGSSFLCLTAMKPMFDVKGIFRYVISASVNIDEDSSDRHLASALGAFLEMVPNIV